MKIIDIDCNSWDGRMWARRLRGYPELAKKCDWGKLNWEDWMYLLRHRPNTVELVSKCDKWELFPIDRVCDLLLAYPQLITACPDMVLRRFGLGHWAKLIREPNQNSDCPVIANHEGRWAAVNKMKELGVAVKVAGSNDRIVVGGFEWCCLFHWAHAYGSVFNIRGRRRAAAEAAKGHATTEEDRVKYIAENSAINPNGDYGGPQGSDNLGHIRHMQWLAAMVADFAAMSKAAAISAPEYAKDYSMIAQAAAYEANVLSHSM